MRFDRSCTFVIRAFGEAFRLGLGLQRSQELLPVRDAVANVRGRHPGVAASGSSGLQARSQGGLCVPELAQEGALVRGCHDPAATLVQLRLQLPGAPATVAGEQQELVALGQAQGHELPSPLEVNGKNAPNDALTLVGQPLGRVQAGADQGAVAEAGAGAVTVPAEPDIPSVTPGRKAQKLQHAVWQGILARELQVTCAEGCGPVQDEAHVPVLAVPHNQDHRLVEVLLLQCKVIPRRREQHRALLDQWHLVGPAYPSVPSLAVLAFGDALAALEALALHQARAEVAPVLVGRCHLLAVALTRAPRGCTRAPTGPQPTPAQAGTACTGPTGLAVGGRGTAAKGLQEAAHAPAGKQRPSRRPQQQHCCQGRCRQRRCWPRCCGSPGLGSPPSLLAVHRQMRLSPGCDGPSHRTAPSPQNHLQASQQSTAHARQPCDPPTPPLLRTGSALRLL
mmetsp:Transcript_58243/g.161015  ORF Transcript_58243/g.161015 Transcript_58243/m.161015 type:complete len:451 (+) Transcript_58243:769-2121(+)